MRDDFAQAIATERAIHGNFGAVAYGAGATADLFTTALREYAAMFFRDLTFALRALRKTPSFTAVVVLTLALAIGANASVFSILNAVVLAPLPYPEPDRLVALHATLHEKKFDLSLPDFADIVRGMPQITQAAAFDMTDATLRATGAPEKIDGIEATPGLFTMLGARPLLGRFPTAADAARGAAKTVVISEALYRRAFAADPQTVGTIVKLDDEPYRVIGVAPGTFAQPKPHYGFGAPDFWTVLPIDGAGTQYQRGWHNFEAIARLAPAATLAQATSSLNNVLARLRQAHPDDDTGLGVSIVPLADSLLGNVRGVLFATFAAVAGVLLVACANVANLLLSRSASREREFSVRIAIGASRGRIVAQLLVETFVLAVVGGAIGIAFAYGAIAAFVAANPPNIPRAGLVAMNGASILYTFGVVAFCTLAAGLAPSFTASQRDVAIALKSAGRGGDASRGARARSALVASEIALTLALVIAAGLVVRSFGSLTAQPLGFEPAGVYIAGDIDLPDRRYPSPIDYSNFYERADRKIASIPGVVAESFGLSIPFEHYSIGTTFTVVGQPVRPGHEPDASLAPVGPQYFRTMHAKILAGREFSRDDRANEPPVAIVNQTFAQTYFAGRSALGQFIVPSISIGNAQPPRRRIVGVVNDLRTSFAKPSQPAIYVPLEQAPFGTVYLAIRTAPGVDPRPAVANAFASLDPLLPRPTIVTMDSLLASDVAVQKLTVVALSALALVALALAIAGVFAVVSYGVTQRTHEFGVRMALGADARQIVRVVVTGAMRLALVGIACGLIVAGVAMRLLSDQLFDTQPLDPLTFGSVTALVLVAALVAALVPARRATRVDPIVALRYE